MSHLLKAMGFWVWGLIVIGLSLSLIVANYRMLSVFRTHASIVTPAASRSTEFSPAVGQGLTTDPKMSSVIDPAIIAQGYLQLKDCANTAIWSDKAIAASRSAGEIPKENLFLYKLQCASNANNSALMIPILIELIRLNHKSTYWNTLLRIERQDAREDRDVLMIYRIMYATDAMAEGSDYIEMAQLLGDAGLPAEGQTVLERAMAAGLIKDQQQQRTLRLLNSYKIAAAAAEKGMTQPEAEAARNPMRELYLGHAEEMDSRPEISPRVREVWRLYAETRQAPEPANVQALSP
jgi:hypothetical protein